jgi:predicted nucleic acid-binding protein
VATLFVDTSALIRRYDHAEPGADAVRQLCDPTSGHLILIAQMTSTEIASALNRKLRERVLSALERDRLWREFQLHRLGQYHVVSLTETSFTIAENLLFSQQLRAYDALQIASSLQATRYFPYHSSEFRFCTADQRQATAATSQGLTVELIA